MVHTGVINVLDKASLCRPILAQSVPAGWDSQISRQSAREFAFTPLELLPGTHFWVDPKAIVRPEGLFQWANPEISLDYNQNSDPTRNKQTPSL